MGVLLDGLKAIFMTVVVSVILILLGLVYFGITLWVIKAASNIFFGTGLEANWAVFAAAIMSTGAVIAGALEKKSFKR